MAEGPTQTSLKMTTGGWELEISVNMEKVPLKVYGETREERQTVCWIASEAGKARPVLGAAPPNSADLRTTCVGVFSYNQRKTFRSQSDQAIPPFPLIPSLTRRTCPS